MDSFFSLPSGDRQTDLGILLYWVQPLLHFYLKTFRLTLTIRWDAVVLGVTGSILEVVSVCGGTVITKFADYVISLINNMILTLSFSIFE